jgi:SAM-dependent methyltransferase
VTLATRLRRAATLAHWDDPQRMFIDRLVARAGREVGARGRVLDASAGQCTYASVFAHCHYVPCDLAVGDATWDYTRIDVVADLEALPFRMGAFGAVLCTQVLEHMANPLAVVRAMQRVLRPGGRLYMSVPFLGDPIHQEPHDCFRSTHFGVGHLLKEAGLRPVVISPIGGVFFLFCCSAWWCATILYRLSTRTALRAVGAGLLAAARICTMSTDVLGQTDRASRYFTYGYAVVAEKSVS